MPPEQRVQSGCAKKKRKGFQRCPDIVLSSFLNGLIYEKRGKDEAAQRRVDGGTSYQQQYCAEKAAYRLFARNR